MPPNGLSTARKVVLFGPADGSSAAAIGATVLKDLSSRGLLISRRAWDLLALSLSVIAADTIIQRKLSADGWTREIELTVAVSDPDFWNAHRGLIEDQLAFLTTDLWSVFFYGAGVDPAPPREVRFAESKSCSLLSGGLDSLVGAIDIAADEKPYFVSQVAHGDKVRQRQFATMLNPDHIALNHSLKGVDAREITQRSRSIIFLAYGVAIATALRTYHEGSNVTLYVCENGLISMNPCLTTGRLGSLSTRTTHPLFLQSYQRLLNAAGINVSISNPYQFKTKGEMLAGCSDQALLYSHAHNSTSCGRYIRTHTHCGRCLPCIIRRASFLAWGKHDQTSYLYHDLSIQDGKHARFDDVRSAAFAICEIEQVGFEEWIRPRLNLPPEIDLQPYVDTVRRGMDEVKSFLQSAGVI